MEALCGRLAAAYEPGYELLGPLATRKYEEGKLSEIIDPNLRKQISADSLDVFSALAYQCLKQSPKERPRIVDVVEKLEEVLGLQQKFEEALAHQQALISKSIPKNPSKQALFISTRFLKSSGAHNGLARTNDE
ncbi:hypothetical protein L1887_28548 [Cichorium endivia]|nr:hypothetical protein L1887_28548 [Cichorium endivia]